MNKHDTALTDAFEAFEAGSAYKNLRWEALDKESVDDALFQIFLEGWLAARKHDAELRRREAPERTCEGFTEEVTKP